jgi:hypothetical protein
VLRCDAARRKKANSPLFEIASVLVRRDHVADAHRGDGKRFVVRADEKLTAFMALESACTRVAPTNH